MTKRNVVWLITKLIGVYFAYWTVVAVLVAIGSIYHYISLPSPPRFGKAESANTQGVSPTYPNNPSFPNPVTNPGAANPAVVNPASAQTGTENTAAEKVKNEALKQLLWNLFVTVIYGLIAWYLIRDGRFLVAVLNREEPFDESGKPLEAESFPLAKKKEEVVTTLNISGHPSRMSDEITSLNLSDTTSAASDSTDAAPGPPVEVLPATPEAPPVSAPPISAELIDTTVSNEARSNPQTFAPDALTNQPVFSPEPPVAPPNDVADDALIEEFNINPPDERK